LTEIRLMHLNDAKHCPTSFEVSWDNGISSEFSDIEEFIDALNWESSSPNSISVKIGSHYTPNISFSIDNDKYTLVRYRSRDSKEYIYHIKTSLENLVKNHIPPYHFLHREITSFCASAFIFSGLIFSTVTAINSIIDISKPYIIGYWAFAGFISLQISQSFFKIYSKSFPTVDIPFGNGRKSASRRAVILFIATSIVLPIATSLFVESLKKGEVAAHASKVPTLPAKKS
jgi:hypothetical protein